jgi:hypothetical protein
MCRAVSPGQRVAATLQELAFGRVVGAQDRGIVGLRSVQSAAQAAEEVSTDRVEQVIPTQLEAIQPALGLDGIRRSQGVSTVRTA